MKRLVGEISQTINERRIDANAIFQSDNQNFA